MTPRFGLTEQELALVQSILCQNLPEGVQVHAFGSRTTGDEKPWSDIDLVLEADRVLPLSLLGLLAEQFDESVLRCKVDLIDRHAVSESFGALVDQAKVPFSLK